MKDYKKAKRVAEVSVGESVKILREFQALSQNALAGLTGIPQATISAIENDRIQLGVEKGESAGQGIGLSSRSTGVSRLGS